AKKLVPRMGEVQSVVASAPALTSPAPIGTSGNTLWAMLTAVKLRDSAWVNVAKPGENTYSGLNVTWYSVPGSKPPWLQNPSVFVWTDAGSAPVPLTRSEEHTSELQSRAPSASGLRPHTA